jgi:cytochrome c oxidase cbb3-type subunit 4
MDLNDIRAGFTLFSLVIFVGIMVWTWNRQRQAAFEEAALLPFKESEPHEQAAGERQ